MIKSRRIDCSLIGYAQGAPLLARLSDYVYTVLVRGSATSLEETCCGVSKGEETAASEPTVLNRRLPLPAFPISTSRASILLPCG